MITNASQFHIDKNNFVHTIDSTIRILQSERETGHIAGGKTICGLTKLEIPKNLVIVGDLHGDMRALKQILEEIDFEKFLSNYNNKMIFLGDYVDRGSRSIELLQYVCHLKHTYSDSIILMRGNHESPIEFPFTSHDLPARLQEHFGEGWDQIYKKILEMFQLFTLVAIINNKLFLVHGGPFTMLDSNYEEFVSTAAQKYGYNDVLKELLWNDPRPLKEDTPFENSRRHFGKHFGMEISKKCLETSKTCAMVRSHEPCHVYRIDHNNMVMTIFSCGESYPNFEPGYLFLTGKQLRKIQNALDLTQYVRKIKKGREDQVDAL